MDATAISQLYRDRGDCENNFNELKNQWGWAVFTTRKLKPCKVEAWQGIVVTRQKQPSKKAQLTNLG